MLAADQRITAWARELKKAGLDGDMDVLRARAYLDLLLGKDSRPAQDADEKDGGGRQDPRGGTGGGSEPADPPGPPAAGPAAGAVPAGFAGRINLTIPLITLLDLADRPGEIPGIGPIDPWLGRDLATAAAGNPKTTSCVTITDEHGRAIGHGCARPQPKSHASRRDKPGGPARRADPIHPPITTQDCDHRFEARGHDPGVKLRHLTQIRYATCTGPVCRRPSTQSDFEHNIPYEAGGRTCLCNGGPSCRR